MAGRPVPSLSARTSAPLLAEGNRTITGQDFRLRRSLFAFVLTLGLLTAFASTASADGGVNIVNGNNASITDYPFQAAVYQADAGSVWDGLFCGAVVLDATHVATAAHCVYDEDFGATAPEDIAVMAGTPSSTTRATRRLATRSVADVVTTSFNPNYDFAPVTHDIARADAFQLDAAVVRRHRRRTRRHAPASLRCRWPRRPTYSRTREPSHGGPVNRQVAGARSIQTRRRPSTRTTFRRPPGDRRCLWFRTRTARTPGARTRSLRACSAPTGTDTGSLLRRQRWPAGRAQPAGITQSPDNDGLMASSPL